MLFNEYQDLTKKTAGDGGLAVFGELLGLAGEAGEVVDLMKKVLCHNHPMDEQATAKLLSELGDTLWYLARIADRAGFRLEDVATVNIEKLKKRYPEGFSATASLARVDTKPILLKP
jgi:NTP pyrophosphatase (non-canonical NTP hydrolase)